MNNLGTSNKKTTTPSLSINDLKRLVLVKEDGTTTSTTMPYADVSRFKTAAECVEDSIKSEVAEKIRAFEIKLSRLDAERESIISQHGRLKATPIMRLKLKDNLRDSAKKAKELVEYMDKLNEEGAKFPFYNEMVDYLLALNESIKTLEEADTILE